MRTSWQIFWRDFTRLMRVPRALIIVVGVIIIPSLYAWFNVNAFWDPYSNTNQFTIAVSNNDTGGTLELPDQPNAEIDIGSEIVDQLRENDQIDWQILPEVEAQEGLRQGDFYANIVIPESFSSDLLSMIGGNFTQPELLYYVNEKTNGVSPTITDTGASTVNDTIANTFKETVGEAAVEQLREAGVDLQGNLDRVNAQASGSLGDVANTLNQAADRADSMADRLAQAQPIVGELDDVVVEVDATLSELESTLGSLRTLIDELSATTAEAATDITQGLVESTTAMESAAAQAEASLRDTTASLDSAVSRLDAGATGAGEALSQVQSALDSLRQSPLSPAISQQISALEDRVASTSEIITGIEQTASATQQTLDSTNNLATSLTNALGTARADSSTAVDQVSSALPQINGILASLSNTVAQTEGGLSASHTLTAETRSLLGGIEEQIGSSARVISEVAGDLRSLSDGARTAQLDVASLLNAATDSETLTTVTGLDSVQIGNYIASPVELNETAVYPAQNYGSQMASFFTNLALWIGAFMLMVIFRVEVDKEGYPRVSVGQAYLAKLFFFLALSTAQALVMGIGNLLFGVQTASITAFLASTVITGWAYTGIIYAIVSALGHLGRGLSVFLIIIQIPGASGLYPIELMPGFFQNMYPYLPFRYGIDAMRETVGGFYNYHFLNYLSILVVMSLIALVLGWMFRRFLGHFNVLFNERLADTGMLANEKVEVIGTPYRLSHVISALSDRQEFQHRVASRAAFLDKNYKSLIHGGVWVGILGVIIITAITWLAPTDKTIMLGIAVAWALLVIVYLGTVEYIKESAIEAGQVSELEENQLQSAIVSKHTRG